MVLTVVFLKSAIKLKNCFSTYIHAEEGMVIKVETEKINAYSIKYNKRTGGRYGMVLF